MPINLSTVSSKQLQTQDSTRRNAAIMGDKSKVVGQNQMDIDLVANNHAKLNEALMAIKESFSQIQIVSDMHARINRFGTSNGEPIKTNATFSGIASFKNTDKAARDDSNIVKEFEESMRVLDNCFMQMALAISSLTPAELGSVYGLADISSVAASSPTVADKMREMEDLHTNLESLAIRWQSVESNPKLLASDPDLFKDTDQAYGGSQQTDSSRSSDEYSSASNLEQMFDELGGMGDLGNRENVLAVCQRATLLIQNCEFTSAVIFGRMAKVMNELLTKIASLESFCGTMKDFFAKALAKAQEADQKNPPQEISWENSNIVQYAQQAGYATTTDQTTVTNSYTVQWLDYVHGSGAYSVDEESHSQTFSTKAEADTFAAGVSGAAVTPNTTTTNHLILCLPHVPALVQQFATQNADGTWNVSKATFSAVVKQVSGELEGVVSSSGSKTKHGALYDDYADQLNSKILDTFLNTVASFVKQVNDNLSNSSNKISLLQNSASTVQSQYMQFLNAYNQNSY